MTRFLIEVAHKNNKNACDQAVQASMATGSHFMTNADWGCGDDEHKAEFIKWINSDHLADLQEMADLEADDAALKTLLAGVDAALALNEAGHLEEAVAKLDQTMADFPGLQFNLATRPAREPMPPLAGYVGMAQVREILTGFLVEAMQ